MERSNEAVLSEFKKGVLKIGKPIRTKQPKQAISSKFLQSFVKLVQGDIAQQNVSLPINGLDQDWPFYNAECSL